MERMLKKFFSMALLASTVVQAANTVAPYFSIRSQSENAARELAGWTGHVNIADMDRHYGSFAITPEYTRSFRSDAIAEKLFGCDLDCGKINIVGSGATAVDATKDWVADYFYLGTGYTGNFCVDPQIQNALVDFNLYWGMDEWVNGMFFRVHAPITWTKWDLGFAPTDNLGTATIGSIVPNAKLTSFSDFSCNQQSPADAVFPADTYKTHPLYYSRLCACDDSKTRLAGIPMDLGWNFLLDDDYHLGLFARAVAPTGNKVESQLLFEPMVGNGHHWELGGGLTGHAILWRSEDAEDKHFGFYADANITHLFKAKQCRTFDLCDKPWSRYMLAFKSSDIADAGTTYEYSPIANLTAHEVKVSVGVQADVAALFNYTSGNFGWDLGYNFWGRTCDKFDKCDDSCNDNCDDSCDNCKCPTFFNELDGNTWSIAGPTAGSSYSNSTIHTIAATADATPQYLSSSDIDYVETKGISHKVFTHFAYNWYDKEDWIPYIGIGGEVAFGPSSDCDSDNCSTTCSDNSCDCINTAVSQWGIWVKGGFSF